MTKQVVKYTTTVILTLFGLLTIFLSGSVIFDLFGIRAKEGNYVLFIVWANFISSIIYLVAAYGFVKQKMWTTQLLGLATLILIMAFSGLYIHINSGGIYEHKTVNAMVFRIILTITFTVISYLINKSKKS